MAAKKTTPNVRAQAALTLVNVIHQHRSLNTALAHALGSVKDNDRAFCQQLCYGVLRWHPTLSFLAQQLLKKPFKTKDADIEALLLIGLYQLRSMRTPAHAAISETVNAAKVLGKQWAAGLLNACLRQYQRNEAKLEQQILTTPTAKYAHPDWLLEHYQQDWPQHWQQIVEANNQQPPMLLRVNALKLKRDAYLAELEQANIHAEKLEAGDSAILLTHAQDVNLLPGFHEGQVSVQDGAAQLATTLLDIRKGQRVLDACAAPGGKTCHILEQEPDNGVVAIDIDADRLKQIQQNLDRLDLNATLIEADAADVKAWWDEQMFDRILIDAPCSGSGVIRRHPDIKLLRRPEDIDALAEKQMQLLANLWPLLKSGGRLVYTTCSAFKQENEAQIAQFLQNHADAEELAFSPSPANRRPHGYQRLPGDDVMDGFYYACLQKL